MKNIRWALFIGLVIVVLTEAMLTYRILIANSLEDALFFADILRNMGVIDTALVLFLFATLLNADTSE
ncbi:MAG: hypothetical protein ACW99U_04765 [Candidatus Thorarchaeota archaeon]|jgi:multisubunit Na+/H+ antiporter MnhF subunit